MTNKSSTERAIAMVNELEDKFRISQTEACRRLGIARMNYCRWVKGTYPISDRVFNRMLTKYNAIKNIDDNASLIKKLQLQMNDIQKQLDFIIGK